MDAIPSNTFGIDKNDRAYRTLIKKTIQKSDTRPYDIYPNNDLFFLMRGLRKDLYIDILNKMKFISDVTEMKSNIVHSPYEKNDSDVVGILDLFDEDLLNDLKTKITTFVTFGTQPNKELLMANIGEKPYVFHGNKILLPYPDSWPSIGEDSGDSNNSSNETENSNNNENTENDDTYANLTLLIQDVCKKLNF